MSKEWLSPGKEILRYLTEHPDAKDTLEGIVDWWLKPAPPHVGKYEVEKILALLVDMEWVVERKSGSSPTKIYGMNRERIEEIRAFLDE